MANRITANKARKRAVANKNSRWFGRSEENRLEPECWPHITPSFKLETGQKIFTIGSCFARNIESHLSELGFEIPMLEIDDKNDSGAFSNQALNKYSPPSIYQELKWAHDIMARDDKVHKYDILPLLIEKGTDQYYDLHIVSQSAKSFETVSKIRKAIYQVYRQAFHANTIVITLGLIEAFWDKLSELYIVGLPVSLRRQELDRFEFSKLNFNECFDYIDQTIQLLDAFGSKNYLITTSPVAMNRTHTKDDVIIANTHSKSTLRAVAGAISDKYTNVDYFPSFESVMLSRSNYVWEDDLQHVNYSFVGKVVNRLVAVYTDLETREQDTEKTQTTNSEDLYDFSAHMQFGNTNLAREIYASIQNPELIEDIVFHVHAARLNMILGNRKSAQAHLKVASKQVSQNEREQIKLVEVFYWLGRRDDAMKFVKRLFQSVKHMPTEPLLLMKIIRFKMPREDQVSLLQEHFENKPGEAAATNHVADLLMEMGQNEAAETVLRKICIDETVDHWPFVKLGNLLAESQKWDEAAAFIQKALDRDDSSPQLKRRMAHILNEAGYLEDAQKFIEDYIQIAPKDAHGYVLQGRILNTLGISDKAIESYETAKAINSKMKFVDKEIDAIKQTLSV